MARRVSVRGIGKNRHYTYEQASDALGLSVQTIRAWKGLGLAVMTDTRPHVIVGEDLIAFVLSRRKPTVRPAPDQFRCFTCQTLTRPLEGIVFYTPLTSTRGNLEAICERCEEPVFKFAGERRLSELGRTLEIVRSKPKQA